MGQESRVAQLRWLCVRSSPEVVVELSARAVVTGATQSTPKVTYLSVGRPSSLLPVPRDINCSLLGSHHWCLTPWQLVFPQANDQKDRATKTDTIWGSIMWSRKWHTITSTICYWPHRLIFVHYRKGLHSGVSTRRQGSWGTTLEAGYHMAALRAYA